MICLTRHARNRMRLWQLTAAEITEALRHPEQVTPSSQANSTPGNRRLRAGCE
jgi:hypothetical protein